MNVLYDSFASSCGRDAGAESEGELDTRKLVLKQNRKKKRSGGFQAMGLGYAVFKGVMKMGYKIPSPIQRKCIPVILEGKDVVAMARTGSGKSAAFLIPMLEKLKTRVPTGGARALIMSPTRELSIQTLQFIKQLGKFTNLKAVPVFGGDSLEDQFAAIHENPDIIIATPGRFLHVVMEMNLKLSSVEYVVFDEADRLFEMGFLVQLNEILKRLPDTRQTLLFSATLPKLLINFVNAGLHDPVLIRLDVESKLNENLKLGFIACRMEDKMALLLHFLKNVIKPGERTFVFLPTKHHIEYVALLLKEVGIQYAYLYSSLDQYVRNNNVELFRKRIVSVMLVTDLAARGIDIPLLDNVINVNFPGKSKLFLHRVGRVARAGCRGTAYSFIATDEMPYLIDLHMFLGRSLSFLKPNSADQDWNGLIGSVPQSVIDEQEEELRIWHTNDIELANMKNVSNNAYKLYMKSRPHASPEASRRAKEDSQLLTFEYHPVFGLSNNQMEQKKSQFMKELKSFQPTSTIFELNHSTKNVSSQIMKEMRNKNVVMRKKYQAKLEKNKQQMLKRNENYGHGNTLENADEEEIKNTFSVVMEQRRSNLKSSYKPRTKRRTTDFKDEEFYVPSKPSDYDTEKGLGMEKSLHQELDGAVLDLTADDHEKMYNQKKMYKWERKKQKFVNTAGVESSKKIKTENGVIVPASFKSDLYEKWQKKTKFSGDNDGDADDSELNIKKHGYRKLLSRRKHQSKSQDRSKAPRRELKSIPEILKARRIKAKNEEQNRKKSRKMGRRKFRKTGPSSGRGGKGGFRKGSRK